MFFHEFGLAVAVRQRMRLIQVFSSIIMLFVYSCNSPSVSGASAEGEGTPNEEINSHGDSGKDPNDSQSNEEETDTGSPLGGLDLSKVCECGESQLQGKDISYAVKSTGALITTANLGIDDDGNIQVRFAPFVDPATGEPFTVADKERISIRTNMSTTGEVCGYKSEFGANTASKADIVFVLDTTGSMGKAVSDMANSINAFAQSLSDANLDVNYAAITVGDAFATKKTTSSAYSLGSGIAVPPTFDSRERPYSDFTGNVVDFKSFIDEVKTVVGNGAGGAGATENYYAAAVAAASKSPNDTLPNFNFLTRRSDALFYEIVIGDNCAYTEEQSGDGINGVFVPPAKAKLSEKLGDAQVKVHSVFIDRNGADANTCAANLLSLKEMSDASTGKSLEVGPDENGVFTVDLNELKIADLIKNFWKVDIKGGCARDIKEFSITASLRVKYSELETKTQYFTFDIVVP